MDAEDLILASDTSQRNWRRRAVGMSRAQAIASIPTRAQIQFTMPIETHRAFRRWCADRNITMFQYVRAAVHDAWRRDGFKP